MQHLARNGRETQQSAKRPLCDASGCEKNHSPSQRCTSRRSTVRSDALTTSLCDYAALMAPLTASIHCCCSAASVARASSGLPCGKRRRRQHSFDPWMRLVMLLWLLNATSQTLCKSLCRRPPRTPARGIRSVFAPLSYQTKCQTRLQPQALRPQ